MKIFVKVKPKAKKEKVDMLSKTNFKVQVKESPEKGRANEAVLRALADYFGTAKSNIRIISGSTSKLKVIELNR